ncbi:hypothetical protein PB2503_08784 [Parvularcula bermudensis HTCC2503]|uniref:Serine aminopeptidase S33 domain-containing protein n=1 Tax=Parvularcula bermudensis (strain ATCC BAA-594 / HTCC2503 / KCTC 12087) TaxID=314260 RepID=E0TC19_PARBH|nr:alpha/beta fold hydrolase [Parvularcula bermudensis]ADM09812.1 hypothetical protein PB2503_08784 [Parvularcula bermudensis HTCC2503]
MSIRPIRTTFTGATGAQLSARIDLPAGTIEGFALFAHCFTCSKDIFAARNIAQALTAQGIGVMRFDFTGLGESEGEFGRTSFSLNLDDLTRAADFLREAYQAPSLLIGHSLGGAAVLAVRPRIPEVKAVVTINAPASVEHVAGHFGDKLATIIAEGQADVSLADRVFTIEKQFVDDLGRHDIPAAAAALDAALLVMHSPIDQVVGIDNATDLFIAAKHPKSFVSLDQADHLLSQKADSAYVAGVIAAWARRYLPKAPAKDEKTAAANNVVVKETALGQFQCFVQVGAHRLIADEPTAMGGLDSGPSPYDFLATALGTCTVMTLRMYAERKQLPLERASCVVSHAKVHAKEADPDEGPMQKIDEFTRRIRLDGDLSDEARGRLLEIADKCPVHRTLEAGARVKTEEDR